jgi:hypothetical protein
MKKSIIIFIGFVICSAFINPLQPVSDYRDACTGTYFCNRVCSSGLGMKVTQTSDTISIVIKKDALDSVLQINVGGQNTKMKLHNKTLQAYPKSGYFGGIFFASDSLDFYLTSGRASSCRYLGKKKS